MGLLNGIDPLHSIAVCKNYFQLALGVRNLKPMQCTCQATLPFRSKEKFQPKKKKTALSRKAAIAKASEMG